MIHLREQEGIVKFSQRCESGLGHASLRQSSKILSGASLELSCVEFPKISLFRLLNSPLQLTPQPRKLFRPFAHLRKRLLDNGFRRRIRSGRNELIDIGSKVAGNGDVHNDPHCTLILNSILNSEVT